MKQFTAPIQLGRFARVCIKTSNRANERIQHDHFMQSTQHHVVYVLTELLDRVL